MDNYDEMYWNWNLINVKSTMRYDVNMFTKDKYIWWAYKKYDVEHIF